MCRKKKFGRQQFSGRPDCKWITFLWGTEREQGSTHRWENFQVPWLQSFSRRSQQRRGKLRPSQIPTWLKLPESFPRSPLSMLGKRWLHDVKSFGCWCSAFAGCEVRAEAGGGYKAAKKKSDRLQTLHVWTLWRQEPSPARRRWWWWGHQRTIDGGVIIVLINLAMKRQTV